MKQTSMSIYVAAVCMVKNEEKRITVTLQSIIGTAQYVIIYDTGSTDDTINVIKRFCEANNLTLYILTGEFIDFSISRNVMLDYADSIVEKGTHIDFLLLLDCNDELRGGKELVSIIGPYKGDDRYDGYMLMQEWWSGILQTYYNLRIIRPCRGWRYKNAVHEFLDKKNEVLLYNSSDKVITANKQEKVASTIASGDLVYLGKFYEADVYRTIIKVDVIGDNTLIEVDKMRPKIPRPTVIYQDRTKDDDKSMRRFSRDKVLLLKDYERDRKDPRIVFYLAQTCCCLQHYEDSFRYYSERVLLEGFYEERFQAYQKLGEVGTILNHPREEIINNYLKAAEVIARAEPLVKLAELYRNEKKFYPSYLFAKAACELEFPSACDLFIDKLVYDYTRYHLLGIVAFYVNNLQVGREACMKALASEERKVRLNSFTQEQLKTFVDIDKNNLEFYDKAMGIGAQVPFPLVTPSVVPQPSGQPLLPSVKETKKQHYDRRYKELVVQVPRLTDKHIATKIRLEWKSKQG